LPAPPLPLVLHADGSCAPERASNLAQALDIPLVAAPPAEGLLLRLTPEHLELHRLGDPTLPGALWVDFNRPVARRRLRHPGEELLIQAAKVRNTAQPLLVDAAAGLGRDGFLLAASGFRVLMFECNPVVAALLADGLQRAGQTLELADIAARIRLTTANALNCLPTLVEQPDVIYLDPMFPERSKTAKVKQDLQLLQLLDQKSEPPEQLLFAALAAQAKKVVVKRPLKGPFLGDRKPSYSLRGKAVRFDVYVGSGKKQKSL
jgi:16S rRNA (guanine1516-N2)-methyltransferase